MAIHPLNGSERAPPQGAKPVGKADPDERLEVTLLVRRRSSDAFAKHMAELAAQGTSARHIGHDDFTRDFGADDSDLSAVRSFAQRHGLAVVECHAARRAVVLSGTVSQFEAAFNVSLEQYEHAGGTYRGRVGAVHLPDELNGVVSAVMGLDNRPQARQTSAHARRTAMCAGRPQRRGRLRSRRCRSRRCMTSLQATERVSASR